MAAKKFMVNLDLNLNELLNVVIQKLASDPVSPIEGQFWFNSTSKQLKYFDGSSVATIAEGEDLTTAVTRAVAASEAGELLVSAGADRSTKTYDGGAGILKSSATGVISAAVVGTDYVTADSTNTLTNKTFDANGTGNSLSNIEVADFAASALATDVATATSSQLVTGEKIKTYVDAAVAGLGQLVGAFDASGGLLPTTGSGLAGVIAQGDYWRISVAGDIVDLGHLEVGDALVASIDGADAAAEFFALQANLTDAVTSDGNVSTDNAIARFDGTTGRMIQNSLVTVDDNGSVNIPAGQAYLVNGIDILTANARKYALTFNDTTDWDGAAAPYSIAVLGTTHNLTASAAVSVTVRDSSGAEVEVDTTVNGSGDVTLISNAKFAGSAVLIG
ncbi:MAG: hypothetical protein RBT40_12680 [Petrimonas sp.]|jgi:hypothetical protein|nr:hypothetical protein [Petrimonas sp.]